MGLLSGDGEGAFDVAAQGSQILFATSRFLIGAAVAERLWPLEYTLTRIFSMEHIHGVESVFDIIVEPHRRAILSLLV